MSTAEMQLRLNIKNVLIFSIAIAFGYLGVLVWKSSRQFPEVDVELQDLISYAMLAAEMGGRAVVKVYGEQKLDTVKKGETAEGKAELLTKADLVSNFLILNVLQRFPGLHVMSEEKESTITAEDAQKYESDKYDVWLNVRGGVEKLPSKKYKLSALTVWVDPLDATQEFTEGLLECVSVMICVAFEGEPIFGVIYRPFANETVFGLSGFGVMNANGEKQWSDAPNETSKRIVVSRSHAGKVKEVAEKAFGTDYTVDGVGGSGYKTLLLLNGSAALYVHTTAIKKWDTCAGDALVRAAGGMMMDLTGDPLDYDRRLPVLNEKGLLAAVRHPYSFLRKWSVSVPKS